MIAVRIRRRCLGRHLRTHGNERTNVAGHPRFRERRLAGRADSTRPNPTSSPRGSGRLRSETSTIRETIEAANSSGRAKLRAKLQPAGQPTPGRKSEAFRPAGASGPDRS